MVGIICPLIRIGLIYFPKNNWRQNPSVPICSNGPDSKLTFRQKALFTVDRFVKLYFRIVSSDNLANLGQKIWKSISFLNTSWNDTGLLQNTDRFINSEKNPELMIRNSWRHGVGMNDNYIHMNLIDLFLVEIRGSLLFPEHLRLMN